MRSSNLPEKSNFQGQSGLAAKTGKANFDISDSQGELATKSIKP
jgi:hypothetical protein